MLTNRILPLMSVAALMLLSVTTAGAVGGATDRASFHANNLFTVKVPEGAKVVRVWFAVPQEDAYTVVSNFKVDSAFPVTFSKDSHNDKIGFVEIKNPEQKEVTIKEDFDVTRREVRNVIDPSKTRPFTDQERAALSEYLTPSTNVPVNDKMKALAATIVGDERNPILVARKLYDWTRTNVDYWVKDPEHCKASPTGNADYCLSSKTGNCSDFHSLFSALAMSAGLPNRMVYGSLMKPSLNGADTDASYHCWVEFFAPNIGWLPVDASLANLYAESTQLNDKNQKLVKLSFPAEYSGPSKDKIEFYFGNMDNRRVVWSTGRDLMMQPAQQDGPVNALNKMYVEVDGKQSPDWTRKFTYKEIVD